MLSLSLTISSQPFLLPMPGLNEIFQRERRQLSPSLLRLVLELNLPLTPVKEIKIDHRFEPELSLR